MKVWKIIHKERDHTKTWRLVCSIVPAESRVEAIKKLDRHESLIKSVKFLGVHTKDTYAQYWDVWQEKTQTLEDDYRDARFKIIFDLPKRKKKE